MVRRTVIAVKSRLVLATGLVMSVFAILTGCFSTTHSLLPLFRVEIVPNSGHPPFEVTITATDMDSGVYTFDLPGQLVEQTSNTLKATVNRDPYEVRVLWSDEENGPLEATKSINVVNEGPTIRRPRLGPNSDWHLRPREKTLLDFNYFAGSMYGEATGIDDPDGDSCHIIQITVRCEIKSVDDSIFCPPYEQGVFHAFWQGYLIDNACIIYPTYTGELSPFLPPAPTSFRSDRIEFVDPFHYDASGNDNRNLNDEYFTLKNTGITYVDMTEWTVTNNTNDSFEFPAGFALSPSKSVAVYSGSGNNTHNKLFWGSEIEVWNNNSDTAVLRNSSGKTVHIYQYPGLPYCPTNELGYPYDGGRTHNLSPGDMPSQTATITVVAEDEWGARTTEIFQIEVGPLDLAGN